MPRWKHKLNLKDLWEAKNEGTITLQQLSKSVSERIRKAPFYEKYTDDLEPIADEFEGLSEESDPSVEWFDDILCTLYDWGDQGDFKKKMCWISTSF